MTPLVTRERVSMAAEDLSVVRSGRSSMEFLVQQAFMRDLRGSTTVLIEKPIRMEKKTAWAHFSAGRVLTKTPREMGHQGLHVVVHCYHRAIQAPLERLNKQWIALWEEKQKEQMHEDAAYRL